MNKYTLFILSVFATSVYAGCNQAGCENVSVDRVYIDGGNLMVNVSNDSTSCGGVYIVLSSYDDARRPHIISRDRIEAAKNKNQPIKFSKLSGCQIGLLSTISAQ